jgi:hypothetical protein
VRRANPAETKKHCGETFAAAAAHEGIGHRHRGLEVLQHENRHPPPCLTVGSRDFVELPDGQVQEWSAPRLVPRLL